MMETLHEFPHETIQFNYDDYLLLPDDGKRYEIIEGELFMAPAPATRHQGLALEWLFHFANSQKRKSWELFS